MKFVLFLLSLFFLTISHSSKAQDGGDDRTNVTANYVLKKPVIAAKCKNLECKAVESDGQEIRAGAVFKIIDILDDGSVIVDFWSGNGNPDGYFRLKPKDYQTKTKPRYATTFIPLRNIHNSWFTGTAITGGVTVIPFKFRPSVEIDGKQMGFDFSKDVQLGLTGGIKQRMSRYRPIFLNVVGNIGISSVTLDSYNTLGTMSQSTDIAALGIATGIILDFKSIQLGAFLGWDKVSDQNRNGWIYQGRPWWSVGFGYSIFSVSTKEAIDAAGDNSVY